MNNGLLQKKPTKPMEFACHTWAFNDKSLTEALGTIARMGFRYVDIGTGPQLDIERLTKHPRGIAAEIRADLALFNLKLSDVYIMLPRISLKEDDKRKQEIQTFRALLPFVIALEAPGVTLSPGLSHPTDDIEAIDRTVASLREMVDAAKQATPATQLDVSIEPHMDSMAQTPQNTLKIIKQVDDLQLTLDWAQMVCQDVFHDEITKLLPHTRHVHIRQAARAQLQTPFDRGRIDVRKVVRSLKDADYEGVVCVEYMQTVGWHGMLEVDPVRESITLRDTLRNARDEVSN